MNEVISPFLPIPVNGMKALVKEDKEKANNIANESGIKLFAELMTLATYHLTLLNPKSVFFDGNQINEVDGDSAILQLDKRDG